MVEKNRIGTKGAYYMAKMWKRRRKITDGQEEVKSRWTFPLHGHLGKMPTLRLEHKAERMQMLYIMARAWCRRELMG